LRVGGGSGVIPCISRVNTAVVRVAVGGTRIAIGGIAIGGIGEKLGVGHKTAIGFRDVVTRALRRKATRHEETQGQEQARANRHHRRASVAALTHETIVSRASLRRIRINAQGLRHTCYRLPRHAARFPRAHFPHDPPRFARVWTRLSVPLRRGSPGFPHERVRRDAPRIGLLADAVPLRAAVGAPFGPHRTQARAHHQRRDDRALHGRPRKRARVGNVHRGALRRTHLGRRSHGESRRRQRVHRRRDHARRSRKGHGAFWRRVRTRIHPRARGRRPARRDDRQRAQRPHGVLRCRCPKPCEPRLGRLRPSGIPAQRASR